MKFILVLTFDLPFQSESHFRNCRYSQYDQWIGVRPWILQTAHAGEPTPVPFDRYGDEDKWVLFLVFAKEVWFRTGGHFKRYCRFSVYSMHRRGQKMDLQAHTLHSVLTRAAK